MQENLNLVKCISSKENNCREVYGEVYAKKTPKTK